MSADLTIIYKPPGLIQFPPTMIPPYVNRRKAMLPSIAATLRLESSVEFARFYQMLSTRDSLGPASPFPRSISKKRPYRPLATKMASSLLLRSSFPRHLTATRRSILALAARKTSSTAYVPGGPILKGSVNEATTFPPPSKTHGSYHWAFERLLSASLVPLTAAAFVISPSNYPVFDGLLGISLVVHSHIGFDSILVDYLHPRKFPLLGPLITWTLRATTVGVLVGVYKFNTEDIGLTELITKVWTA